MPAHVAYPGWDEVGWAATFSRSLLSYLRNVLCFDGLVVTDAFIMAGATAAAPEVAAGVDAIHAGCDMLLYPTDWARVARALEAVFPERAEAALARYEETISKWGRGEGGMLDDAMLAEHQKFADGLGDRAVHLVRGEAPRLGKSLQVSIVDDDVGGPYLIPPRDVFAKTLKDAGMGTTGYRRADSGNRIVLVYAEPRSWKGRADLGERSLAQLARLAPGARLVILFAHPRLAAQVPGDAPILCSWHGQALMQRAAARWVGARTD
jgi:beta-glucosidase-like glycosyl hydrolase